MSVCSVLAAALLLQAGVPPQLAGIPPASPALLEAASALASLPQTVILGYPVSGDDRRRIRTSMNAERPGDATGEKRDAVTFWRYEFGAAPFAEGQCRPETLEVRYTVLIALPDLTTRNQIDAGERAEWDRFVSAVIRHEGHHRQLAVDGADQLRAAMRTAPTCEAAQAVAAAVSERIAQASVAYDAETRHGAAEGALY